MSGTYKSLVAKYKEEKRDLELAIKNIPKSIKKKKYTLTAELAKDTFGWGRIQLGKYACPRDVQNALAAYEKTNDYKDIRVEPPIET